LQDLVVVVLLLSFCQFTKKGTQIALDFLAGILQAAAAVSIKTRSISNSNAVALLLLLKTYGVFFWLFERKHDEKQNDSSTPKQRTQQKKNKKRVRLHAPRICQSLKIAE
jgi:hypothetical protein